MSEAVESGTEASVKQQGIVRDLRRKIINGRFPPGSQLPSQAALARHYDVCRVTAQRAVQHLERTGHIDIKHRVGAFVVEHPPHLYKIGLAFGTPQEKSRNLSFHNLLRAEFERAIRDERKENGIQWGLSCCYGQHGFVDPADRRPLVEAAREHQLAALILLSDFQFVAEPLASLPEPPVKISFGKMPGMVCMDIHNNEAFYSKALDYLAGRGKRRVGFVLCSDGGGSYEGRYAKVSEMVSGHGLTTRPYWVQGGTVDMKQWVAHGVEAMLHCAEADRPDALIIRDDNFVPAVTARLRQTGLRFPADVEIVAHCNYPEPTPSAVPAVRLGYDVREVVRRCFDLLRRSRRGEDLPEEMSIQPVFQQERNRRSG
jgi:DNA-binding LacI/PurR family transcriptional regulator